ncbi:MAG: phage tail protein [Gemmatimonadales bacterium]|nr:MAG: phage tail protein [Gemmatimonadales bacterium]
MAELPRLDPLPAFNFYVALIDASDVASTLKSGLAGFLLGGFSSCSGLDSTLTVEEYQEGGVNDRVHRFPSRFSFGNITLSRGVGFGESLWLWHEEFLAGRGTRRNGLIVLADELRVPLKIWSFNRGIPVRWSGPGLDAGTSSLAIESLEIAHERLELVLSPGKTLDGVLGALP